jgi:hypothetical protein
MNSENENIDLENEDIDPENKDIDLENEDIDLENADIGSDNEDIDLENKDIDSDNAMLYVINKLEDIYNIEVVNRNITLFINRDAGDYLSLIVWPEKLQNIHTILIGNNLLLQSVEKTIMDVNNMQWPKYLQKLEFGDGFNSDISQIQLPLNIKVVKFGYHFNQCISNISWPISLNELIFGHKFNNYIVSWPDSIKFLTLGNDYSFINDLLKPNDLLEPNDLLKPNNITLPTSLQNFTYVSRNMSKLRFIKWPNNLTSFTYIQECDYDEYYDADGKYDSDANEYDSNNVNINFLPDTIINLDMSKHIYFNTILSLPRELCRIKFSKFFNKYIESWPNNLTLIQFGTRFNQDIDNMATLYKLDTLIFGEEFNKSINAVYNLPLTSLALDNHFAQNVVYLPKSLHKLIYMNQIDAILEWPPNLETLIYNTNHISSLLMLPNSIKHLAFGYDFNTSLSISISMSMSLPECIDITFGYGYNQDISDIKFPNSIMYMTFGYDFDQILTNVKWPNKLLYIYDYSEKITIESSNFPPTLYQIIHVYDDEDDLDHDYEYIITDNTIKNGHPVYTKQNGTRTKSAITF